MQELIVPIVVVGAFALVGLVSWILARRQERSARFRAGLQLKLSERFTTVRELEDFLQTEAGRSHEEIAGILTLRPASVRVMLFRARARLARSLKRAGLGSEALW